MTGRTGAVICIEGPSAVGKTSLGLALAGLAGVPLVEEVTGAPPPDTAPESWFVPLHVEHWARAVGLAGTARFAVLDGDPFKALWYNRVFATDPLATVIAATGRYAAAMAQGELEWPDLYIVLDASEEQLRMRRAGDASRTRRNLDRHLTLVEPIRRYFAELATVMPGRVLRPDTSDRHSLAAQVMRALAALPPSRPEPLSVLTHMTGWLRGQTTHRG